MKPEHEAFGSDTISGQQGSPREPSEAVPLGEEPRRYETCAGCGEEWNVSRRAREGWYICPRCAYRYGRR